MSKYFYPNYSNHPPTPQAELDAQESYGQFESVFVGGGALAALAGFCWFIWYTLTAGLN